MAPPNNRGAKEVVLPVPRGEQNLIAGTALTPNTTVTDKAPRIPGLVEQTKSSPQERQPETLLLWSPYHLPTLAARLPLRIS